MVDQQRSLVVLTRLLLLGAVVALSGCSGHKTVYHVKGKVLVNGQPAVNAAVVFHPEPPSEKFPERPRGTVGADGSFQLTTYRYQDGAPAGRYAVTVSWVELARKGDDIVNDYLPPQYKNPTTSGLTAEVKSGSNDLPPFELTITR